MVPPSSPVWRHLNSSDHASSAVSLPATTSGCRLALKNLCISPSRMVPLFWLSNFWNTWKKKYLSNFPLNSYFPPSLPPFLPLSLPPSLLPLHSSLFPYLSDKCLPLFTHVSHQSTHTSLHIHPFTILETATASCTQQLPQLIKVLHNNKNGKP